jgi:hypothetical protein
MCAVEIGSGAMVYIPTFKNICSGIQKLKGRREYIDTRQADLISLLLFFQNEESGLITDRFGFVALEGYEHTEIS